MAGALAWSVLAALVVTLVLLPWVRRYTLSAGLIDRPEARRSHADPTPRGGGIAMGAGLLAAAAWVLPAPLMVAVLPPLAVVLVLGIVDDHRAVPVRFRFPWQVLAAVWLVVFLGGVDAVAVAGRIVVAPWLWSPLAVVAVIWLINLHNFMDGANGIAAGQGVFAGLVFAGLFLHHDRPEPAALALATAVVYAAFLPWNLSRRGFFMGDAGSMVLGLMVAAFALLGAVTGSVSIWQSLLVSSLFVVDATATLAARVAAGRRWYTPHRQHVYQRLIGTGMSHVGVALVYAGVNVVLVLPAVVVSVLWREYDFVAAVTACILLIAVHRLIWRITDKDRKEQ